MGQELERLSLLVQCERDGKTAIKTWAADFQKKQPAP